MNSDLLSPSSTVFRVRRKRGANPLAGLVVSSKKARNDSLENSDFASNVNTMPKTCPSPQEIIFRLVGTSELPHVKNATPFFEKDHKVVEMVDYNPENNLLGKRQISVLDQQYLEVMRAAKAISDFALDEQEKKDFEEASTAPLAKAELDDDEGNNKEYVYDFYFPARTELCTIIPLDSGLEIRLPTDKELQLFYGGDDDDSEEADNDLDSNNENHYKNDYPDEDELEDENDTTSDDSYNHYGDEDSDFNDIYNHSDCDSNFF